MDRTAGTAILRCLGAEEKEFHRQKHTGALYALNQRLIGELVMVTGLEGKPEFLAKACSGKGSPSVALLEALLFDGEGWSTSGEATTPVEGNIRQELVKDLVATAPEILLEFLSQLQAEAPTADCLEKHVPGLKTMNQEVRWLQEEVDLAKLAGHKARLRPIFSKVRGIQAVFAQCRQEARQRKEKSKETESASGKPSAQ